MDTVPEDLTGNEPAVVEAVRRAIQEDRATDDVTTALLGELAALMGVGKFRAEEPLVVAGLPVAGRAFEELDDSCVLTAEVVDGDRVAAGQVCATVRGPAGALLAGERVALNFLQRLSAIATQTRRAVDAIRGTGAEITDTRKTTPGLRFLEKYAVRVGGGVSHRFSLADAVLWKDNHWAMLEGSRRRLGDVLRGVPEGMPVIVEVENERQLEEALSAGVQRILVDNQAPARVAAWAERGGPGVAIEASGGITPDTARAYAEAGARYISIGSLTHSVHAAALSFELTMPR